MLSVLCAAYRGGSKSGRSVPAANCLSSVQSATPIPYCCLLLAVQSVHPAQKNNRKLHLSWLESDDDVIFSSLHPICVYTRPCIVFYSEIAISIDMPLYLPGYTVPSRIGCSGYGCDGIQQPRTKRIRALCLNTQLMVCYP